MEFHISIKPLDRELVAGRGEDLLTALHAGGIDIESICGGMGTCGKCRVHVLKGKVSDPTPEEQDHFTGDQLAQGLRLACQVLPASDLTIYIPASSLTQEQRLQLDSELDVNDIAPAVHSYRLEVDVTTSPGDPESDRFRLREALRAALPGMQNAQVDLAAMKDLSSLLREEGGSVRVVTRGGEILGFISRQRSPLGLAVDLGSTKVALFLHDLMHGELLISRGFLNPQIPFGEDIVSRIRRAIEGEASRLQEVVVESINSHLSEMLAQSGRAAADIFEVVLVGNTAMHHLFLGLPVKQLGKSPYVPVTDLPIEVKAKDLGLELNPAAVVYLPPPIAGYVGSDHLAAVAAVHLRDRAGPCLFLDIGTNTEVALKSHDRISSCSCASGPAFEGGGLSQGMRAGDGAIEQVAIDPSTGKPELKIIGDAPAAGICGSGILSALAALTGAGIVDTSGRMREDASGVERRGGELVYYLAQPGEGTAEGVAITQNDIREIQKAKGAIRTGIDALLLEEGIDYSAIVEIVLAGAFGTFIDPAAALAISLLPPIPLERISQVGNAAGAGSRSLLLSARLREETEDMAKGIAYLELSSYPQFNFIFAADMYLSEQTVMDAKRRFKI